jgi:outer membrane lipoprotein-sorting protein
MAKISRKLIPCLVTGLPLGTLGMLFASLFVIGVDGSQPAAAWSRSDSEEIVSKMEAAYGSLKDYQTNLVITGFGKGPSFSGIQKLTYTFKKPNKIRIDFESPHEGMAIVYPDAGGDVAIRPSKRFPSIVLHLDAQSSLMEISPGQHVNETDIGLLIRNISHSLTDMFLGGLDVTENHERLFIHVLSDNPFRKGMPTRYRFTIDKKLWLPVAVEESTPDGALKRRVAYENLRTNIGISDRFFLLGLDRV